jgi:hypothetical protein
MKTKTNEYVKKPTTSPECKPIPCDIPPFCRNNYFTGKLLTERDLNAEQRYLSDKLRLHHLALHGWGVICGLKVRSHPYCPNLRVIVEPGLAIDPCGRFIRVLEEMEIELPKPMDRPAAAKDPCPPDRPKGNYPQGGYGGGSTESGGSYTPGSTGYGGAPPYGTPGGQDYPKTGGLGRYGDSSGYDASRGYNPSRGYDPSSGYDPSRGQDPTRGYDPSRGQDPTRGYDPSRGQDPTRGYDPSRGQDPTRGYDPSRGQDPTRGYDPSRGQDPTRGYDPSRVQDPSRGGGGTSDYGPPDQGGSYQPDRPYGQDYGEEPGPIEPFQPTVNLYFCLSYAESDDEMMPAPFDECACTGSGQKPNRICETFKLTVSTEPPSGLDEIQKRKDTCLVDDCHDLYRSMLDRCPEPTTVECLPLAVVEGHMLGEPVTEDRIDNWSVRLILPSTQLLDQLIYCVLDKVSTKSLTKILDINWNHRGDYHSHDFMRQFIGDAQTPRGFEITFGNPVRSEGLSPRTFQAIAVRYADRYSGGQMEVVPARVRMSSDRMKAYLEIDRGYAERKLFGIRFDLFLILRCGHIVDDKGLPVDGELLAKIDSDGQYVVAPPTGDGVEGGLFESWIKVRTGPREEQKSGAI